MLGKAKPGLLSLTVIINRGEGEEKMGVWY